MQAPNDPLDACLALARTLEEAGISYAIGGALAYGIWGIPRATLDVDVNVFLEDSELGALADALGPEALAVFKLLFFRPKDIVDLERLIAVQGDALDHKYVRQELASMMGEEDERVRRWDELMASSSV